MNEATTYRELVDAYKAAQAKACSAKINTPELKAAVAKCREIDKQLRAYDAATPVFYRHSQIGNYTNDWADSCRNVGNYRRSIRGWKIKLIMALAVAVICAAIVIQTIYFNE